MRHTLVRLLGPEGWLKPSFRPHRMGFLISSQRCESSLRRALIPRWAVRIVPIHRESGRYFLAPSSDFLVSSVGQLDAPALMHKHSEAIRESDFFSASRRDRLRRLEPILNRRAGRRAVSHLSSLTLRVEGLPWTPRPDRQWQNLAADFDEAWQRRPLLRSPLSRTDRAALQFLWICWSQGDEMGDHGE